MKTTEAQTIYSSPAVKVVEIKARKVLCGSDPQKNGLQTYGREDW